MNKLKEINGKFYQECEVVMLTTEKATWPNCIWLGRISNQLRLDTSYNHKPKSISPIDNSMLPQHLYFLSNEEIKEGDWCYHPEVSQEYSIVTKEGTKTGLHPTQGVFQWKSTTNPWYKKAKKIIATTDLSLNINNYSDVDRLIDFEYNLPQPSQSFIQAFIKAYNEGKPITKVLVECWAHTEEDIQLKVNLSNEVTIKKVKNSYTREEVITFTTILRHFINEKQRSVYEVDKFIEDSI